MEVSPVSSCETALSQPEQLATQWKHKWKMRVGAFILKEYLLRTQAKPVKWIQPESKSSTLKNRPTKTTFQRKRHTCSTCCLRYCQDIFGLNFHSFYIFGTGTSADHLLKVALENTLVQGKQTCNQIPPWGVRSKTVREAYECRKILGSLSEMAWFIVTARKLRNLIVSKHTEAVRFNWLPSRLLVAGEKWWQFPFLHTCESCGGGVASTLQNHVCVQAFKCDQFRCHLPEVEHDQTRVPLLENVRITCTSSLQEKRQISTCSILPSLTIQKNSWWYPGGMKVLVNRGKCVTWQNLACFVHPLPHVQPRWLIIVYLCVVGWCQSICILAQQSYRRGGVTLRACP